MMNMDNTNGAEQTCVECGKTGHFDCAVRDKAVRDACPSYMAMLPLLSDDDQGGECVD